MKRITQLAEFAAMGAYALLLWRLWWTRTYAILPWFTGYVALMIVDLIARPLTVPGALRIEPALLALRILAVLEVLTIATEKATPNARAWFFRSLCFIALLAICGPLFYIPTIPDWMASAGYQAPNPLVFWYTNARWVIHIGLCMMAGIGLLFYWWNPKLNRMAIRHHAILTAYFLARVIVGMLVFGKGRGQGDWWLEVRTWFLAFVCLCCVAWWRWGMLSTRPARPATS